MSGRVRSLADILANPGALAAPASIIPRLVWRERVTLLAAREKDGKSTLAQAGAAAVSRGRMFLDETAVLNRVLFLALEEHTADVANRFVDFKCDPSRIYILDRLDLDPFGELVEAVEEIQPAVVVVDTLAEFTKAMGLEGGSARDWQPVMSQFTRIARDMDTGVLSLHHARKSDGRYRDSSAIGAGVDVLIEMQPGAEPSIRKMEVRARWAIGNYAVRLAGNPDDNTDCWRFELADGEAVPGRPHHPPHREQPGLQHARLANGCQWSRKGYRVYPEAAHPDWRDREPGGRHGLQAPPERFPIPNPRNRWVGTACGDGPRGRRPVAEPRPGGDGRWIE